MVWLGEILHHAIGRLVRRINSILLDGDSEQSNIVHNAGALDSTTRVTLVSGHDITVMPLLYAVGGWKEGEDDWPNYTSTVVFELLEPLEEGTKYVRGFYYPGVLSENDKAGDIQMREIMFGDDEGIHPLGRRRKHVPLADFVNLLG